MTSPNVRSAEWILTQLNDIRAKLASVSAQLGYLGLALPDHAQLHIAEHAITAAITHVQAFRRQQREEEQKDG